MKMYTDLTVEGTPEECAAFKHIDAALTARNKPKLKAIEGPKKTPAKKVPSKRVVRKEPKGPATNEVAEMIIGLALAKDGVTANEVAEYLEMDKKAAYNRLYQMRAKGLLWQTGEGVFKAHRKDTTEYSIESG